MQEKEFTTFDIGKVCNVAHTTVINWIERGELVAHVTPGGHRRVYLSDFIAFMNKYKMRIPESLLAAQRKPSVLIVDDEADMLVLLTRAFRQHAPGLCVRATRSGLNALVMAGREPPDVVILDVVMPNMDGMDVCRTLKETAAFKPVKVLVITGKKLSGVQRKYFLETTDGIFHKPLSPVKIVERTLQVLEE